MLKDIQLKSHRAASVNMYVGTSASEHPILQRKGILNTVPVDKRPRTEGHRHHTHHGNGNYPIEGSSVFSQQPIRRTVEQLTADRSRLVSGVLALVFVRSGHSLSKYILGYY